MGQASFENLEWLWLVEKILVMDDTIALVFIINFSWDIIVEFWFEWIIMLLRIDIVILNPWVDWNVKDWNFSFEMEMGMHVLMNEDCQTIAI